MIGGIGAGKSLVAAEFAKHGGKIIAGDQLGHEALRQPAIRQRIVERWGAEVLDEHGQVSRRRLGARVFADVAQLRELEQLVFPYIEQRITEEIDKANTTADAAFIVLDAAVMLEAGWNKVCHWLVYIDVPREIRLQRLAQVRGWGEKEVQARESVQLSVNEKQQKADFAVDNSGSPEQTARQVEQLLRRLGLLPQVSA